MNRQQQLDEMRNDMDRVEAGVYDIPTIIKCDGKESNIEPNHYTKWKIAPNEYITANNLEWEVGNVVKYVTRYEDKNGLEDLVKAMKYISILIKRKYNKEV